MSSTTTDKTFTDTSNQTCMTSPSSDAIGMYFIIFFVIMAIVWILLFSFNPYITQKTVDTADGVQENVEKIPDPVKCFWVAFVVALIIIIIVAIAKTCGK